MSERAIGRRIAVAGAAVVAVAAAVAAAVGFGGDDGGTAEATDLPPATAEVTRQTLVDAETKDGELGYDTETTLAGRTAGTVTWLPGTGVTVKRGGTLYRVDDERVVLLYGSLPAYRELRSGLEGADVKQFERNLAALGYDGFTVDDEYTSATADAVRDWQDDLGLPETGRVEPGRIAYAAGPVRVDALGVAVGDAVQPGASVLTVTATARVVSVTLDVDDQRLARKGTAVRLTTPDGERVGGKITKVESVVEEGDAPDAESETKIEVTISVDKPAAVAGYDQATMEVDFTASERKDVLTVPVAALLALAEGGYGLELIEGSTSRIIAVETGLFADGRVEVSGDGLTEGTTVGMPS
ncbi:MAG TPA: peptidoglycan-binding protein [Micromonosporaceae bacterium]|nr:peptidoglycan-binding protein [Micromonosporaceae bacterium]